MALSLPTHFSDFLDAVRPTAEQRTRHRDGHLELRGRLLSYPTLKDLVVTTFLQGSYRRQTSLQATNGKRSDVDIVAVTKISEHEFTPQRALAAFAPFVEEYYPDKGRPQGRSIGIKLPGLDMDLVVTSAPAKSEFGILAALATTDDDENQAWKAKPQWATLVEESVKIAKAVNDSADSPNWKAAPLRIPDCDANKWENTHPVAQIVWTQGKSGRCNGHFVSVVRAIKWWKYDRHPEAPRPASYPLERMIGECCPDNIGSVAEGLVKTLEALAARFRGGKPILRDIGTGNDVLKRVTEAEYRTFTALLPGAASLARQAYDAADAATAVPLWRNLLGERFPPPPGASGGPTGGGFTGRKGPSDLDSGRFA